MPCLNEVETLAGCIQQAQETLREHRIDGEIVVADNGSTDGSTQIATDMGARLVHVARKGYGNALMGELLRLRGNTSSWGTPMPATISVNPPGSLRNSARATTWSWDVGCRLEAARYVRAPCPSCIDGWAIRSFHSWAVVVPCPHS